jgi:hypothetical protein
MSNRSGRTATVRKSDGAILEARTASPAPCLSAYLVLALRLRRFLGK